MRHLQRAEEKTDMSNRRWSMNQSRSLANGFSQQAVIAFRLRTARTAGAAINQRPFLEENGMVRMTCRATRSSPSSRLMPSVMMMNRRYEHA
jgi:hypothetical protein